MDIKATVESGLVALKGFYEVVNTKEKALLLILVWVLVNLGGLSYRFVTPEAIERLMRANCETNHHHAAEQLKSLESRPIVTEKTQG